MNNAVVDADNGAGAGDDESEGDFMATSSRMNSICYFYHRILSSILSVSISNLLGGLHVTLITLIP